MMVWVKVILCFSLIKNGRRLFSSSSNEGSSESLSCLYGIRFLTMSWIVVGHVWIQGLIQVNQNTAGLLEVNIKNLFNHFKLMLDVNYYYIRMVVNFNGKGLPMELWLWMVSSSLEASWCATTSSNIWRKRRANFILPLSTFIVTLGSQIDYLNKSLKSAGFNN